MSLRKRSGFIGLWALSTVLLAGCGGSAAEAQSTPAQSGETIVDCDAGDSLSQAVADAQDGDTIEVSGECEESVFIPRTLTDLTLDGQESATLIGPSLDEAPTGPDAFTVFVQGQDIKITGFNISGGVHGIHLSGPSSSAITNNVITGTGGAIHIDKQSVAEISGNDIIENSGYGINIQEGSYARIGFTAPTRGVDGNTIQDNDGDGVRVDLFSSAWIAGNEIADNNGNGVFVNRSSDAEVLANSIGGNVQDGIHVLDNASLLMTAQGAEAPVQEGANESPEPNGQYGLRCETGGFVSGEIGTLNGASADQLVSNSCEDHLNN